MKMYAMRKIGLGYTSGKTTDFTSVPGYDMEKGAISCNKESRDILERVGYYPNKGTYLYNGAIAAVMSRLTSLKVTGTKSNMIVKSLISFMTVCLEKGYDIRFW